MATKKKAPAEPQEPETKEVELETVLMAMAGAMKRQADLLQELLDRIPTRTKLS